MSQEMTSGRASSTSSNENVAERTPEPPVVLDALAASVLEEARSSTDHRAALTLTPSPGGRLKQTLIAVADGGSVAPAHWNGPATLQILHGQAVVSGVDGTLDRGAWTTIPRDDAQISAQGDLVGLLTVAPEPGSDA